MTDHRNEPDETERANATTPDTDPGADPSDAPSNEYEPNDSRNVTGAAKTADGRWSGDRQNGQGSGEYEPRDSRNVTGAATTEDGRWTNDNNDLAPGDD